MAGVQYYERKLGELQSFVKEMEKNKFKINELRELCIKSKSDMFSLVKENERMQKELFEKLLKG